MIERDIVAQKIKEFQIEEYIKSNLTRSGYSKTKLQRTPLGEKIIVYVSRPGMVVGRQGQTIRKLTSELKEKFNLENPQIEVSEVKNIFLDPSIVAEMIVFSLERFGSQRFKGVMHKTLGNVLDAGALGVEIILSGKLPSARARSWRVYGGYLKKCGDIAVSGVKKTNAIAKLKSGIIGVKVSIMPPDLRLPDKIEFYDEMEVISEEVKEEVKEEEKKEDKPKTSEKRSASDGAQKAKLSDKAKKKTTKKKTEEKKPKKETKKISEAKKSSDDAQKAKLSDKKVEEPAEEKKEEEVKEDKPTEPAPEPVEVSEDKNPSGKDVEKEEVKIDEPVKEEVSETPKEEVKEEAKPAEEAKPEPVEKEE